MSPQISNTERPALSDAEWSLITELLERERKQLPIEIHHTTGRAYREQLRNRLQLVETLLSKLNPAAP
jgi:hypothetical protein